MDDKKKLLLIVPTLHQGGQERVVVRTAGIMSDRFDVTIAIFDDSDIGYDTEGLDIVNLNVPSVRPRLFKLINILRRTLRLKSLKRKLHPDISYSFGGSANIVNSLSASSSELTWTGLRTFIDVTETSKMKLFARKSDLIVCCSTDIMTEVKKRYPGANTDVLHNPFDIERITKEAELNEPDEPLKTEDEYGRRIRYIMTMGRDDDSKMYWAMLKCFKLIHTDLSDTRLVILGAGDFESYKRMAVKLGIEDLVTFTGAVDNPYRYLKYADVYWTTSRTEGFPNAVVEALALGLPTVSTNCWVGPAEILCKDGSVERCEAEFERRFTISGRGSGSGWLQALPGYSEEIDMNSAPIADTVEVNGDEEYPMAILGDYGILTPAMIMNKDMDYAHITKADYECAKVVVLLMRDTHMLEHYRKTAVSGARLFGCESYRDELLRLAGKRKA